MSEIDAAIPETIEHATTGIPKRRDLILNRPGNINYAGERGSFPGCRLVEFTSQGGVNGLEEADFNKFRAQLDAAKVDGLADISASTVANLYFQHRANLLIVQATVDAGGSFWVLYTNQLEGDEMEDFQEYSRFVSAHMEEFREKRAAKRAKEQEAEEAIKAEAAQLIELGKKEKAGGFVARARRAEDEVERLSKELLKLKAKLQKLEK